MDILSILKQEKIFLIELLDILKDEKDALIKDDIKRIKEIDIKKQQIIDNISNMEKERLKVYNGKRLKEIIPYLNIPDRDSVRRQGEEIERIISNISDVNTTNHRLLCQSLNYVKMVINLSSPQKARIYGSNGKMDDRLQATSIINKSI